MNNLVCFQCYICLTGGYILRRLSHKKRTKNYISFSSSYANVKKRSLALHQIQRCDKNAAFLISFSGTPCGPDVVVVITWQTCVEPEVKPGSIFFGLSFNHAAAASQQSDTNPAQRTTALDITQRLLLLLLISWDALPAFLAASDLGVNAA